jgi:Carboxypeptidase regulatory-like domain
MFSWRSIRVIAVGVLAALCVMGQTQEPAVKNERAEAVANGAITGRVVNENGQPLTGAFVQARAIGGSGPGQSTTSDREGEFRFTGLDRAAYVISAGMAAYTPAPRDPSSTAQPTYRIGDSVTLTLIKGGVVTGVVTNANGEPVVAVNVRVQMSRDGNGRRVASGFSREKPTDDRGVYRIYGLLPGTYVVSAGGRSSYGASERDAFDADVPTYAPSASRDAAMETSVRAGEEVSGVDIRYLGEQGRIVSGEVKMPAEMAFNIILSASGEGVVPWQTTTYSQGGGNRSFMFNGIGDGEYQLLAMSFPRAARELSAAVKKIVVRGADVTGIELTTVPLATISGHVVLEESKAPECVDKERPQFNDTVVSAWHNDNEASKETPATLWSIGAPVTADADGNFVLRNLAGGEYYFATRLTAKYWYLQSITFAPLAASATAKGAGKPVDATLVWTKVKMGDRISGLTVTVAKGAASLRGQVVSAGQQIPEKLFLYLVPSEQEKAEAVLRYYATAVTPDGKIALHNIAPGRYWVLAQRFTEDVATPLTRLRLPDAAEARARLRREAEAAKTEIEFKPCQNVVDFRFPLQ